MARSPKTPVTNEMTKLQPLGGQTSSVQASGAKEIGANSQKVVSSNKKTLSVVKSKKVSIPKNVSVAFGGEGESFRAYSKDFYGKLYKNSFLTAKSAPDSLLPLTLNTMAYSNLRKTLLVQGKLPDGNLSLIHI